MGAAWREAFSSWFKRRHRWTRGEPFLCGNMAMAKQKFTQRQLYLKLSQ